LVKPVKDFDLFQAIAVVATGKPKIDVASAG
jgi:hypothetical protein